MHLNNLLIIDQIYQLILSSTLTLLIFFFKINQGRRAGSGGWNTLDQTPLYYHCHLPPPPSPWLPLSSHISLQHHPCLPDVTVSNPLFEDKILKISSITLKVLYSFSIAYYFHFKLLRLFIFQTIPSRNLTIGAFFNVGDVKSGDINFFSMKISISNQCLYKYYYIYIYNSAYSYYCIFKANK